MNTGKTPRVHKIIIFPAEQSDDLPDQTDHLPDQTDDLLEQTDNLPEDSDDLLEQSDDLPERSDDLLEQGDFLPEQTDDLPEQTDDLPEVRSLPAEVRSNLPEIWSRRSGIRHLNAIETPGDRNQRLHELSGKFIRHSAKSFIRSSRGRAELQPRRLRCPDIWTALVRLRSHSLATTVS
ncbi:MAG TPA: hypothetical protein VIV82_09985 [Verrucomicrobiae bacterium]